VIRHTKWLLLGIVALLIGVFLVITSEMLEASAGEDEMIGRIDHGLIESLAKIRTPDLNAAAINITALGSGTVLTILVIILGVVFLLLRKFQASIQIGAAGIGSIILTELFKGHFERARPDSAQHLVDVGGYSYPSGHSLSAGAVYFTVAMIACAAAERNRDRAILVMMFSILIIGVALSRVYLGVHYFSDVTAGILLGVAWAALLGSLPLFLKAWRTKNVD
jgi:undecaprenyl-diphosphatase